MVILNKLVDVIAINNYVEFTQLHFIDLCETVLFRKASIFDQCALKDTSPLCGQ